MDEELTLKKIKLKSSKSAKNNFENCYFNRINNWSRDPERINNGIKVDEQFTYCSDNNKHWMNIE